MRHLPCHRVNPYLKVTGLLKKIDAAKSQDFLVVLFSPYRLSDRQHIDLISQFISGDISDWFHTLRHSFKEGCSLTCSALLLFSITLSFKILLSFSHLSQVARHYSRNKSGTNLMEETLSFLELRNILRFPHLPVYFSCWLISMSLSFSLYNLSHSHWETECRYANIWLISWHYIHTKSCNQVHVPSRSIWLLMREEIRSPLLLSSYRFRSQ